MTEPTKHEPDSSDTPSRNRVGAPKGSQNAFRHGLVAGKLPQGLAYVEKKTNIFRRRLEAAVIEIKGEVSIPDAAAINSATKWERHAMLALHWLREESDKLPVSERLRFSEIIAKASDARDKNIRALGLDAPKLTNWIFPANSNE